MPSEPLVIIPARLHSSRLPGKPLKRIGPKTLVEHARDSALEADVVPVITSDSMDVLNMVYPDHDHSFRQVCLTSRDLESGTDRCAALIEQTMGWDDAPDWIINVQGDMPFGTAPFIKRLIQEIDYSEHYGMLTPLCRLEYVFGEGFSGQGRFRDGEDVDFDRKSTWVHVGIYAWHKSALMEFYENRSNNYLCSVERERNLEQMRGGDWDIKLINVKNYLPPLEVNTQADLDRINEIVARCQPGAISTQQARNLALASGG